MTPEQQQEILDQEKLILRMVDKKETESRTQEQEDVQLADKKDSEKRMFNWKVIGTAMLGGKFDVKLPIKK